MTWQDLSDEELTARLANRRWPRGTIEWVVEHRESEDVVEYLDGLLSG